MSAVVEVRLIRRGRRIVERRVFASGKAQERVIGSVKPASFFRAVEDRLLRIWRDEDREPLLRRRVPARWVKPEQAPSLRLVRPNGAGPACWRCTRERVRVYGVPCPSCRIVLHAEYLKARAANGGRLLYLPDRGPLPLLAMGGAR
jgi:hypothetical protein